MLHESMSPVPSPFMNVARLCVVFVWHVSMPSLCGTSLCRLCIDSPWTNQLNEQLVYLQEQGELARLKDRWWENDGEQCDVSIPLLVQDAGEGRM